jgi:hypothetical protein
LTSALYLSYLTYSIYGLSCFLSLDLLFLADSFALFSFDLAIVI